MPSHFLGTAMPEKFEKPVHLVLRIPMVAQIAKQRFSVVDAHNVIFEKLGNVAVAKWGQSGTRARADRLQRQIENGSETLLILVAKSGGQFLGFQAPLSGVHLGKPTAQIRAISPPYYDQLGEGSSLWCTVNRAFVPADLQNLHLASNERPLLDVLGDSRTTSMLVKSSEHPANRNRV
jgi:hypothetical protein